MTLHEVQDWVENTKCVPTALAAITGLTIRAVMEAINAESEEHRFTQFEEVPPKYWLATLERLGHPHDVDHGHASLSIDELIAKSYSPDAILVFAKDQALSVTHVFAMQGNRFVDCHTRGRIAEFTETPNDMKGFKVLGEIFFRH
jgi:hypothetical protein